MKIKSNGSITPNPFSIQQFNNNVDIKCFEIPRFYYGNTDSETDISELYDTNPVDLSKCNVVMRLSNPDDKINQGNNLFISNDKGENEFSDDDDIVVVNWIITNNVSDYAGKRTYQLEFYDGDILAFRTQIMNFVVKDSLDTEENIIIHQPSIFQEFEDKLNDIMNDTNDYTEFIEKEVSEQTSVIGEEINDSVDVKISAINTKVNSLESGSPLVASSVSGMTDTSRVYVNTSDGKWYYYNGSSWVIGGVYQATEDSDTLNVVYSYVKSCCQKIVPKMLNNSVGENGQHIETTTRIATAEIYKADDIFSITPLSGFKYQIYVVDDGIRKKYWNPLNNTLNNASAWVTDLSTAYVDKLKEITTDAYIIILLAKLDNSNITPAEASNLEIYFKSKNNKVSKFIDIFNNDNMFFDTKINNYINKLNFIKGATLYTENGQALIADSNSATKRAVTNDLYYTDVDIVFSLSDYTRYQNNLFLYDANENFISRTGYTSNKIEINKGSYFRILLKTKNEDVIDSGVLSSILRDATCYPKNFLPNYYTKEQVDDLIAGPDFSITKIMNITSPTGNPNVTQQSIATDGDNIYVLYPSDAGTNVGVVQVYNKGGLLIREFSNIPMGHASNTAYHNGKLYVMGFKRKSTSFNLVIIDVNDGTYESKDITVGQGVEPKVWDGCSIYGGYLYLIGYDNTAHVTQKQPTTAQCCIISLNDYSTMKFIELSKPNHNIYTTQGVAVYKNKMYAITSSSDNSQAFLQGMNIDVYNLSDGTVETTSYTATQFQEPEGACCLDGYLCTSLVNKGGLYRVAKI